MKKVLIVDGRRMIGDSVKMQIVIEELENEFDVTACAPENAEELKRIIQGKYFDFVLVEHDMLGTVCNPKTFGSTKVYGYVSDKKVLDNFDRFKLPYLGMAKTSEDLLLIMQRINEGKATVQESHPVVSANPATVQQVMEDDDEEEEVTMNPADALKSVQSQPVPQVTFAAPAAEPEVPSPQQQAEVSPPRPAVRPTRPAERSNEQVKEFRMGAYSEYEEKPHEFHEPETKTRVISVYSAKGGVGKSTLSTNIALYLSMMDHGRDKYKVCLVDYNIESGDVRTILGFKGEKLVDMGIWAEDIHQQLLHHANPDDITFTREQIFRYLEPYHDKTGLYVLLAPQLHENAQFIEANEIKVMLDNIIKFGGFDFVICDTADNTSDSSYCALEASDTVCLVCTQDVTTATRNDSVLRSLKHTGMDMTKFRIIINNVTTKRKAGVSVGEIESYFDGYECIGRIHENSAVLHANNYASPLVLKPNNPFTEDLRNVVLYLLGNKGTDQAPKKKKGLFSRR